MNLSAGDIPAVIQGIGGLFLSILVLEALASLFILKSIGMIWLVGVATSLPFIIGLLAGGHWLVEGLLPPRRYVRTLRWTVIGLASFLILNAPIIVVIPPANPLLAVSWMRWAAALGAGTGLLIGIYEARTIERASQAERERVRAEQIQTREQLLAYLNSLLRHEVLNTATVIVGYATHIRAEVEDDAVKDKLGIIQRQGAELTSVIEDVRVLLDATRDQADLKLLDVTTIIEREIANLRDVFETVEVETHLPEEAEVVADKLLRRAIGNLLENAVEHNDDPTPRVEVTVERTADTVTVEISDNGPGIPAGDRADLFELEGREDSSHGLGLGLVATIIERYDGTVSLTETGSNGSVFTIELPRHSSSATAE